MKEPTTAEVYAIKVTLLGTRPPVWRRILVERDISLRNLHRTLQTVMGWSNSHLHQFVLPRQENSYAKHGLGTNDIVRENARLGDLICTAGARLLYEYDLGDGWQHELVLEEILLGDESFQQICVAGQRCCPPEDCGGPQGFAELIKALQNADHPDHEDTYEWLGDFAPESFSKEAINRRLRRGNHRNRREPMGITRRKSSPALMDHGSERYLISETDLRIARDAALCHSSNYRPTGNALHVDGGKNIVG